MGMNAPSLLGLAVGFLLLGLLFGGIEALFRSRPGPSWWRRRSARTDIVWFLFTSFVARFVIAFGIAVVVIALVLAGGGSVGAFRDAVAQGRFPDLSVLGLGGVLRALPFGVQFLLGLLLSDFIGYWSHRAFHGRRLWPFHAVHHSSEQLDWLSSVRVHPINSLVSRVVAAVPLLLVGFDPAVFAAVAPFLTLYGVMLHANVGWSFGPLRYVLASPAFHRWHHTAEEAGIDKNFAGLFPLWDAVFGTLYLPNRAPMRFGAPGSGVPETFFAQLAHPFRR